MYNFVSLHFKWCLLVIIIFLKTGVFAQYPNRKPTIRLSQGILLGTKVFSESGAIADAFYGIPYAAPPVANLRFAPPQRHHGWNGTLQALHQVPACPQLSINQRSAQINDEDCLYLNIWAPENSGRYGSNPVIIIFEGVDFARLNSIRISGQDLAMENVVIVTVNYRTNVFGFLSVGTADLRGNYGLIDQYFAMIWVRENVKHFGGDAEKVTLLGHGSGAASVAFHITSPRTSGLFQRAIMASGSILSPWNLPMTQFESSEKIISLLGCYNDYSTAMMQCLRSKRTIDILKAYEEYIESGNAPDGFTPVIDTFLPESDRYLPNEPVSAFQQHLFPQIQILFGVSKVITNPQFVQWEQISQQGAIQLQQLFEQYKLKAVIRKYNLDLQNHEEIAELIKWKYLYGTQNNARHILDQIKDFEYDSKILAPHYLQLNHLLRTYLQPIYVYDFDNFGLMVNNHTSADSFITSDLVLLFGPLLLNQLARRRFTSTEMRQSQKFKQMIVNFVNFGNPTPNNNMKIWKKYDSQDYYIETLDGQLLNIEKSKSISFWTQLLPKLSNPNFYSGDNSRELYLSPDPAAGFRHAMYILVGLVVALLGLLAICIVLLKRKSKEMERRLHMGY